GLAKSDLHRAVAGLRAAGCGQFLLTLMSDHWETMLARLRHLRALRAASPDLEMAIAGWHLEGPFLSAEPGFAGAHDPAVMIDPTPQRIQRLREAAGPDPVLLTLAPERHGAIQAIECAVSLGIKVSLGHTNARAQTLSSAVPAGAAGFTHLANACPQLLDRHDNIVWRVLDTPGLMLSLIPDGHHVSPMLFRLVHRLVPEQAIYYTTDAVAAAGAPPGLYTVRRHEGEVGPEQIVRHPGRSNYAGSALQPLEGVRRAAAMLGRHWRNVWDCFSRRPAQFMGWSSELTAGAPAQFCLVTTDAEDQLSDVRTICSW